MRLHRGLTPSPLAQGQSLLDAARKLAGEAADRRPGVRISGPGDCSARSRSARRVEIPARRWDSSL